MTKPFYARNYMTIMVAVVITIIMETMETMEIMATAAPRKPAPTRTSAQKILCMRNSK